MKLRGAFGGLMSAFICLSSLTCRRGEEVKAEYPEGVPVIHNPSHPGSPQGAASQLTLKEELSVGVSTERPETSFSRIRDIEVDDLNRIYILDAKACHIKVFDGSGKYLRTIGKQGQGPEEFSRPFGMSLVGQGLIAVEDMGNRLIKFLDLDGHYVKSLITAKMRMFARATFSSQGFILGMVTAVDPENPVYEMTKFDSALNPIKVLRTCPLPAQSGLDPFLPVFYFQVDRNDNIVYGFPKNYEIEILNPEGGVLKRITKDYDPIEITEEEKETERKNHPPEIRLVFSKYYPPFRLFMCDDEGRIIVQARERRDGRLGYVYDVFDEQGRYIVKFNIDATPLLWRRGKMYALAESEEGFQYIKRYKVTWEP
jgi:6-bladed beta-propeller